MAPDRIVGAQDRIMFLIVAGDDAGDALGHLGFDRALETERVVALSNVVKGEGLPSGGIHAALGALLDWGAERVGFASVWATPFSDNVRAVHMLRRAGFVFEQTIPLRARSLAGGRVEYGPVQPGDSASPDRTHLLMRRSLS